MPSGRPSGRRLLASALLACAAAARGATGGASPDCATPEDLTYALLLGGASAETALCTVRDVFGGAAELCASELGGMGVSEGDFAAYVAAVARQCGGPGES